MFLSQPQNEYACKYNSSVLMANIHNILNIIIVIIIYYIICIGDGYDKGFGHTESCKSGGTNSRILS